MTRPNQIIAEVCREYGITRDEILSQRRDRKFSYPRRKCYYRMRTELGLSYPRIAELMKRKNHTSVLHGIGRYYDALFGNPNIKLTTGEVRKLAKRVKPGSVDFDAVDIPPQPKPKRCPIRANAHRKWFVLEWVADGGTQDEALEPYGLTFGERMEFVRRYLPELSGLREDQKISKARELLGRKVAA